MASLDEQISDARRAYDAAASKVGKASYLNGNGGEKLVAVTYQALVNLNNQDPNRSHLMLPKKKYRKGG